ncbi:MAG TPA: lytic murein transglycosylase, partial [Dehalococcoidia bacterium]|nr:lytic murein transglycosylase [Dehalococcoidia bacterium]
MATAAEMDFAAWLEGVRAEALTRGISAGTLDAAFAGAAPIPRVIELDRQQPEFTLSFGEYLDRVAPPSRVETGRRMLELNRDLLEEVWRRYGVPPPVVVALWGVESDFGR